jgi:hypothetical protein
MKNIIKQPVSDETKKKLSDRRKGHITPEYVKDKIRMALQGTTIPNEVKEKISQSLKGRTFSEETRIKRSRSMGTLPFQDQLGNIYQTQREAERKTGVPSPHISMILNGKRKQSYGYTFKYCPPSLLPQQEDKDKAPASPLLPVSTTDNPPSLDNPFSPT